MDDDDDHVPRSWFPEGLDPGDKVTLDMSTGSEWVIDRLVNKHSYQCADRSLDSYACVLFECHNAASGQEAFMRVYAQVPHTCYEDADRAIRTREATEFTPPELKAYKFLKEKRSQNTPLLLAYKQGSQDSSSGAVPRGHLTWIVWEKVPGERLGDFKSTFVYWDMDREERKRVREVFLREFPKAKNMGYFPERARPGTLVWDSDTGALYFVGFRDAESFKAKGTFGIEWLPRFDLARPPRSYLWNKNFNGDISDWKV